MRAIVLIIAAGCHESGSGGGDDDGGDNLVGECDPQPGSVALATQSVELSSAQNCFDGGLSNLDVVEDLDGWNAAFGTCDVELPAGIDFATQRVAIVHPPCMPVDFRFSSESASEIVVGVMASVSGACITDVLAVPLPKSPKPVRVAQCMVDCGDCPPVP
jgi:hypothetical protein